MNDHFFGNFSLNACEDMCLKNKRKEVGTRSGPERVGLVRWRFGRTRQRVRITGNTRAFVMCLDIMCNITLAHVRWVPVHWTTRMLQQHVHDLWCGRW